MQHTPRARPTRSTRPDVSQNQPRASEWRRQQQQARIRPRSPPSRPSRPPSRRQAIRRTTSRCTRPPTRRTLTAKTRTPNTSNTNASARKSSRRGPAQRADTRTLPPRHSITSPIGTMRRHRPTRPPRVTAADSRCRAPGRSPPNRSPALRLPAQQ